MSPDKPAIKTPPDSKTAAGGCRADLIFDSRARTKQTGPIHVVGEYICDFRRADWEHRWADWNTHHNPYLNLFLCTEHAKKLGLIK